MPTSPDPADQPSLLNLVPQQPRGPTLRSTIREDALRQSPGAPVLMLRPLPVKVRSILGHAIAYTTTHVLIEWDDGGRYHVRWEASWLVRRL